MLCLADEVTAICRLCSNIGSTRIIGKFSFFFFSFAWVKNRGQNHDFPAPESSQQAQECFVNNYNLEKDCPARAGSGGSSLLTARHDLSAGNQGESLSDQEERSGQ
jgi:hypothetical protein